jgi:hypothetical protein
MTARRARAILGGLVLCAASGLGASQVQPWGQNAAVLRVNARRCAGSANDRVGTGFLWGTARQTVTALHVIAGCSSITVHSQKDGADFTASVSRVYRHADLALLTLDNNVGATPLVEATALPQLHQTLTTWGYGDSPVSMRSFDVRVAGVVESRLGQNVPDDVIQEIRKAGSPEPDMDILPISDPIAAGLSGAPIFDAAGRVHGIADGGVNHGATHASWAIPVKYLASLARSTESAAGYVADTAHLSAAEVTRAEVYRADFVDLTAPTVKCGSATLRRVRTVPFVQASLSTDNPVGLIQLESFFQQPAPQFDIDVYADAQSGAAVALPAGTGLLSNGAGCIATSPDRSLGILVQVTNIPAGDNGMMTASMFEGAAASPVPQFWRQDPAWTNYQPASRPDGLSVIRKAWVCYYPQNQYNFPTRYMFETLAVRGRTFLGVAGFRNNDAVMWACVNRIPMPSCPGMEYFAGWMQLALSVHLATFPITAGSQTGSWSR